MLSDLLEDTLLVEYACLDSKGRNKGWHNFGALRTLDDLPETRARIQARHPNRTICVKVWCYNAFTGSVQVA